MKLLKLLTLALLLVALTAKADDRSFSFTGTIEAGKTYVHELPGGQYFRLMPNDKGWHIFILDQKGDNARDYAAITPPLHGINATEIEGWHFRNADNTGPNAGSVNAPQEERAFQFAATPESLKAIMDYYAAFPANSGKLPDQPLGKATLTIKSYELTAPQKGKQAAFTKLVFTVTGKFENGQPRP